MEDMILLGIVVDVDVVDDVALAVAEWASKIPRVSKCEFTDKSSRWQLLLLSAATKLLLDMLEVIEK